MHYKLPALVALCTLFPLTAQATYWTPHIGVDYKYWHVMPYQEKTLPIHDSTTVSYPFGDDYPRRPWKSMFPRIDNAFNIYVGTRINGFFGIDFGYDGSQSREKAYLFSDLDIPFSGFPPILYEQLGNASVIDLQLHALHLDFNFYWEVVRQLEVVFMFGAAFLHTNMHIHHFNVDNGVWLELDGQSRAKYTGRFGLGLQYNITPCLGVRTLVNWESTNRIEFQGNYDNPEHTFFIIKPYVKSTSFNVGFVYSFAPVRREHHIDVY